MPRTGKITPQQIQKAKKIIALLPKKDNGLTREEVGELLEKDFRLAFKKGYTPQEICFIFREFGITIPVKIVSKYQMAGDAAEIDGDRLKEICGKFAMNKGAGSSEDNNVAVKNELNGREEIADAKADDGASGSEENASNASIDAPASDKNCNVSVKNTGYQPDKFSSASGQNTIGRWQNTEPITEKDATGGMAKSGAGRQNHWDDLDMDDWCGPAKSGRAYAQGG